MEELVAQFSALYDVEYAEPNYIASVPDLDLKATAAKAEPWPARTFAPPGWHDVRVGKSRGRTSSRWASYPSEYYSQWGFGSCRR